ncbi:MAG: DUF4376 domain-containing protein [Magnetospirillum sp.]|nr:DUF4376 domain-containing protein [Magnetospirillum sp.]
MAEYVLGDDLSIVYGDTSPVVGEDGTQYPGNWPKSDIPGLREVVQTDRPTDPALVALGTEVRMVEAVPTRVWLTEARPLAELQAERIGEMEAAYAAAVGLSVEFTTAGGVSNFFQADQSSVANLQATLAGYGASQETPAGFYWVAEDNVRVPFTFADLQGLAAAMLVRGWEAFQRLQDRKDSIRQAADAAAVLAVVW